MYIILFLGKWSYKIAQNYNVVTAFCVSLCASVSGTSSCGLEM
jgi:hypothetical protein